MSGKIRWKWIKGSFYRSEISEGEKYYFDGYNLAITGKDGKTVYDKEEFSGILSFRKRVKFLMI